MSELERVAIIGSPGAGKSTLSRRLGALTDLPLIHLDAEYWLPGWREPDRSSWHRRLAEIVAGPRWIIDGNYGGSLAERLTRCDTAIVLDYPTVVCLWRVLRRIAQGRGRVRADMAPGCPEQLNWEFLRYIATFRSRVRPRNEQRLKSFRGTILRFSSPAALDRWVAATFP